MIGLMALAAAGASSRHVYDWCKAPEVSIDGVACTLFVDGVIRGIEAVVRFQKIQPAFCIPDSVRQRRRELVIVTYVDKHPSYRRLDSGEVAVAALHEAFPCR